VLADSAGVLVQTFMKVGPEHRRFYIFGIIGNNKEIFKKNLDMK